MKQIFRSTAFFAALLATGVSFNAKATSERSRYPAPVAVSGFSSNSHAVAGAAAGAISASGSVASVGATQTQTQGDTVVNASGGYIQSNIPRAPAATAFAAPLTSGIDTCMGSTSAGVQAVGFGVSVGSTWVDENCKRLKNSRELRLMGYGEAALALMCQDPAVALAMRTAGTPCFAVKE